MAEEKNIDGLLSNWIEGKTQDEELKNSFSESDITAFKLILKQTENLRPDIEKIEFDREIYFSKKEAKVVPLFS